MLPFFGVRMILFLAVKTALYLGLSLTNCLRRGFGQEEDSNDIIGDNSEEEVRL